MSEVDRELLSRVWNTDAPEGKAWVCPDCSSWASLGGNAGFHVQETGHRLPTLQKAPIPDKLMIDISVDKRAAQLLAAALLEYAKSRDMNSPVGKFENAVALDIKAHIDAALKLE